MVCGLICFLCVRLAINIKRLVFMSSIRILLVEDEIKLAHAIQQSLQEEAYEVVLAASGEDGYFLVRSEIFDVLILDLNLPGRGGLEILRNLRQSGWRNPALIVTARDGLDDRVNGLDSGADDYLVKPFEFPELHARLRALLRRGANPEAAKSCCADLELDRMTRCVTRENVRIDLTLKEFDLLEFLLRHKGHIVSRRMITQELWGFRAGVVNLDNVIDVHMARLRAKVDTPFNLPLIRTIRGVGFSLQANGA